MLCIGCPFAAAITSVTTPRGIGTCSPPWPRAIAATLAPIGDPSMFRRVGSRSLAAIIPIPGTATRPVRMGSVGWFNASTGMADPIPADADRNDCAV